MGVALYAISKKNSQISALQSHLAKANEKLDTPLGRVISKETAERAEVDQALKDIRTRIDNHCYGAGLDGADKGVDIRDLGTLAIDATYAVNARYSRIYNLAQEILDSPNPGMEKIGKAVFYCG